MVLCLFTNIYKRRNYMKRDSQNSPITPDFLSRKELSKRLGISAGTTFRLDKEGVFPSFKIGGQVKYRYDDVIASIERHNAQAKSKNSYK